MTIKEVTTVGFKVPEEMTMAEEFEKNCIDVYKKDITTQYVYFTITHNYFAEGIKLKSKEKNHEL